MKLSGAERTATGFKPACIDKTGVAKPFGASTVLEFVEGRASCQMVLYKVELAHIDADDGLLNSFGDTDWDLDVNVLSLGVDDSGGGLAVEPSPVGVGGEVTVTLTLTDMFGVPAYDAAKLVSLFVSGANFQTLELVDHQNGIYTASYIAENHGLDLIEATVNGEPVTSDSDGTSDGVFHLTVVPLDGEIDVTPRLAEKGVEFPVE